MNASTAVCLCGHPTLFIEREDIILLRATSKDALKALTIFKSLHGIDAEHCPSEKSMQFVELRTTQSDWATRDDTLNNATNSIAISLHLLYQLLHFLCHSGIWTSHTVCLCEREVKRLIVPPDREVSHLHGICHDRNAKLS